MKMKSTHSQTGIPESTNNNCYYYITNNNRSFPLIAETNSIVVAVIAEPAVYMVIGKASNQ